MDRAIVGGTCEPFNRAPYMRKVKRRVACERLVVHFGLGLNALVTGIIVYAEFFLR